MVPSLTPSRRTPTGRPRGRPPGKSSAARRAAQDATLGGAVASEPPLKKRKYIPGGPGGGGRFIDPDDPEYENAPVVSRPRMPRTTVNGATPIPQRERSTRGRSGGLDDVQTSSAAAIAASVQQADDYKPREERSWEEFHPNLDIDQNFMIFHADEVDALPQPDTSSAPATQTPGTPLNGSTTPSRQVNPASTGNTPNPQGRSDTNPFETTNHGTPTRRPRRPTRDVISFYGTRPLDFGAGNIWTPKKTPAILPLKNQTAKEKLDLKLPSYRKTNRIELFESKTFGQARYVDKAMSNVGYQESDQFIRPERQLIHAMDHYADDDLEQSVVRPEDGGQTSRLGRVEYDMDEQDDMWLEQINVQRKQSELETITREIFEIAMTKIEKEWHALERRIPKPNPKPPQTHRPRSGSAAAVNGEPQSGEEPDSKCAICDDGDCENTNAIVFCDGCNLAVHQECYGVPFIPEGQWLCRKCQLCGRGVPTCIFCPNTDGAFKQTNSSKWAHLLCAMWIPEISLGNHTFMEPVMDVEKVPKTRWKLNCYICNQRMGACIQCGNKNCYQAFHVTCARRSRLYLKMKTPNGALAVLDGNMVLKAFCDRHCPEEYAQENDVHGATKAAKKFYKRNMQGRIWADSHAIANVIAAQQRTAVIETDAPDELAGASAPLDKKKGQPPKNVWRLPSGAPVIPQTVFEVVELSLQRFAFRKRKDFVGEACRYWTLKREARRGAALLKRLQLQMDSFSSMELTRRDFAAMGPDGKDKLSRRIDFAQGLIKELDQLKNMAQELVQREQVKLETVELEHEFVDECYFPIAKLLSPAIERALSLDKELFESGLLLLQARIEDRHYVTALAFAQDLGDIIHSGIITHPEAAEILIDGSTLADDSPVKNVFADIRERRKLGKRILKAAQPYLETALRAESEISGKTFESLQKSLESRIDISLDTQHAANNLQEAAVHDAPLPLRISVEQPDDQDTAIIKAGKSSGEEDDVDEDTLIPDTTITDGAEDRDIDMEDAEDLKVLPNGVDTSHTPPNSNGYISIPPSRPLPNPPTPPQSNGSFGKEPCDPLADGGVLWYLKPFQPDGTTVGEEHWAAGRDAVRMLSEDLTDLDDEELKGLGRDVDGAVTPAVEEVAAAVSAAPSHTSSPAAKSKTAKVNKKRRAFTRRR